jgi:hypothetical protein
MRSHVAKSILVITLEQRSILSQMGISFSQIHETHGELMPRKVTTEPIKRLTIELPEPEYKILENYCLEHQETKRQVIRSLIRSLKSHLRN